MAKEDLHPPAEELFDASDKEQVKKRSLSAKRREKEAREVMQELLSKPAGRNWAWGMLEAGHIFETSFSPDQATMAFREGERNFALRLLAQITAAAPDALLRMMREKGQA